MAEMKYRTYAEIVESMMESMSTPKELEAGSVLAAMWLEPMVKSNFRSMIEKLLLMKPDNVFQVESLESVLNSVTYDAEDLKLWSGLNQEE